MKGYKTCNITVNKNHYRPLVHRLIAENFIPNQFNKPVVNHKDGNKSNNSIKNLEWVTHKENTAHAIETGLKVNLYGEDNGKSTITKKQAKRICKMLEENELCLDDIAEANNTTRGVVGSIKYGYTWIDVSKHYDVKRHNKSKKRVYHGPKKKSIKLKEEEVIRICDQLADNKLSVNEIAKINDVSVSKVNSIRYGYAWTKISSNYDFSHRNERKKRYVYGKE